MKLSELLNISFPKLGEAMSKDDLKKKMQDDQRERYYDSMLSALHRLVTSKGKKHSIGSYAFEIGRTFGFNGKDLEQMYRDKYHVTEADEYQVTQPMLNKLESYLDQLFGSLGIDVEFTRHFLDRVNDERNKKQITLKELAILFKDTYTKYGKKIAQMGPDSEAVIKDMRSDVNLPFALNWDNTNQELDLVAKTVMRKKNFYTPDPELPLT
jgi:hypothetical protein